MVLTNNNIKLIATTYKFNINRHIKAYKTKMVKIGLY